MMMLNLSFKKDREMNAEEDSSVDASLPGRVLAEIKRVREHVIPAYEAIGPSGFFALAMIRPLVREGERALVTHDALAMLRILPRLQECST